MVVIGSPSASEGPLQLKRLLMRIWLECQVDLTNLLWSRARTSAIRLTSQNGAINAPGRERPGIEKSTIFY